MSYRPIYFSAHTPDNTFLGFVIESIDNLNASIPKQNKAVVYGKRDVFWKVSTSFLFKNFVDVLQLMYFG